MDFPNLPYFIDGDFKLTESKAVTVYICDRFCPRLMGANVAERSRVVQLQNILGDYVFGFMGMGFRGSA